MSHDIDPDDELYSRLQIRPRPHRWSVPSVDMVVPGWDKDAGAAPSCPETSRGEWRPLEGWDSP